MSGETIDLNAEREVDFRSAWERIKARWWLALGGLLAGAILGVIAAAGGGTVYDANTLLYMGQPFTPQGGGQIQTLQTNPKTVPEIIKSDQAVQKAMDASGLTRAQLRGNVTSTPITIATGQTARNLSPLVQITVQAKVKEKAEKASLSFARSVMETVSPYVESKVAQLNEQLAADNAQLERLDARTKALLAQQAKILSGGGLALGDRLIVSQGINSNLAVSEAQRLTIQQDVTATKQLLALADQVERPRVISEPIGHKTSATSRRNALIVGALAGLIAGSLLAIMLDGWLGRRRAAAA
ncbi:MAG: hypothetical protein U0R50_14025 [Gaiellales bacterium]